jgi:hypothetical protein
MEPIDAIPITDSPEPIRANERIDKEEPMCAAINKLAQLPNRACERTEIEEPSSKKPRTEQRLAPERTMSP